MTVLTETPENQPPIQWQDNDSSTEACLLFNGKIMTVLTEAPGNLSTIQWQDIDSSDRNSRSLPTIQWQDNDSSDRSTRKPTSYSLARY